ncbi:YccF domain-containing protein [Nocardioides sp. Bht2]|uniref:YccF domain-containing protein n=1 Tax=Nocardioides sp. Bht2 TaxID=3392297 RepID=UPI0039B57F6B
MKFVLNVIWLVLAGIWLFLGYLVAALICFITIIGIPFGIASFRIGVYALWPFGRAVVRKPTAGAGSAIGNVLWFIFAGIWLAIDHAIVGVLLCLTIIGIPLGIASFKMIPISLLPMGREIISTDDLDAAMVAYRI